MQLYTYADIHICMYVRMHVVFSTLAGMHAMQNGAEVAYYAVIHICRYTHMYVRMHVVFSTLAGMHAMQNGAEVAYYAVKHICRYTHMYVCTHACRVQHLSRYACDPKWRPARRGCIVCLRWAR
jgi:hypothetical protein